MSCKNGSPAVEGHWPAARVGLAGGRGGSPASVSDASTSAAPPIWSNEFRSPGGRSAFDTASDGLLSDTPAGVAARIAALTSIVPTNMDARAPQENGFYGDGQSWLLRALTGGP